MPGNSGGHSQTSSSQRSSRIPKRCQQPANALFPNAEDFDINGGRFENGNVVNNVDVGVTFHLTKQNGHEPPVSAVQRSLMEQDEQASNGVVSTESKSMTTGDGETATLGSTVTSRSPRPYVIYATRLAPKRSGWALWMPEPNNNLPFPYRKKGVQIGDVGIIVPDGSFSFIFNTCVSRDHPINPPTLPEEFAPIHPPIDPIDIRRLAAFKAGSYLASTSVEEIEDDAISPALSFQSSGSEGAILTMPEGAMSEDLENLRNFREYASANVKMWYKYIIGTRGREAKNGDVRLVVGCDKATSWGVAALPNTNQPTKLKFKPLDAQVSGSRSCGYTWKLSGTADVRDGPNQEEVDGLRREDSDDESASQDNYLNQCLFVRTLNLDLNADEWKKLNDEIGVGHTLNSLTEHGTGTPSHSPSNRGPSSDSTQTTSSTTGGWGTQRTASDSSTTEGLTISMPPSAISCHPSRIVNETLLKKFPNARMAITHDEDWYSCIQEDMTIPSDPDQILASLLTVNDIREDNRVVYLEPKVTREIHSGYPIRLIDQMRETTRSSERRQAIRRWGVPFDESSSEIASTITDSEGSTTSGGSVRFGSGASSTTSLTSYLGSDPFDLSKAGQEKVQSPEQNSTSRQNRGSYNNTSTTDHRVNDRVTAHTSNAPRVFIQNLLNVSSHAPAAGHGPAPVPSGAFPSISSGESARPMDHLTAHIRETTITSSRYESHGRVPNTDAADFDNRVNESLNRKPRTRRTIPGQPGEDEYDYEQGQWAYSIEGSSRPSGDPRVQQPSNHPDQHSSHSIPNPVVQNLQDHSHDRADPSRLGAERDKYSRQPQKDMFNLYSSSSHHPADHAQPSSDEDSGEDSYSSNGSGSETAAPSPRSGRGTGSRATYKTRSTGLSIPILALPPLDIYQSQQPWVAEPSGYEKESTRLPAQPTSSQDARGRGADTDFAVGSYRGEVGGLSGLSISKAMSQQAWVGQLAASGDSQSCSGNKEKESTRSRREESRVRGTDEDYVAGGQGLIEGYRGEAGGRISGHPSDSQSRPSHKEKESTRLPMQPSSSRHHPRDRGADTEFGVGSYLGEAGDGGISGHPSDSQSRSGNKEKESARSRREESRARGINEDYVTGGQGSVGGHQGEAGGGISGHHSQSRSGYKEKESARLPMQPSSSRQDPRGKGADTAFVVGSYRGEAGGGISGHPSDSKSRSGNKEKERARSLGQPNSSLQEPRADYGTVGQGSVGGYRGEASAGASGQPQSWAGKPTPALAPSSTQQPSGRQPEYTSAIRSPYAERDNRSSIAMMGTSEHSSRPPPNPTTSIPHRQEEDSPPYNTRGSGWGSSQPDPSRTSPYGAFPPIRPPQPAAQYQHSSQAQGSLGSQRPERTWDGGSSRPSGGRDSSSNPSAGATRSYPWGGQPTGIPPGWSAHPPHPGLIVPPPLRATERYLSSEHISRHGSDGGEGDIGLSYSQQRRLANIDSSQQTLLRLEVQSLGNPSLVPFIKGRGNENLGLSKNVDSHIPLYMCSNIIDPDTIAFWFPAPKLFPPSGGRRGVQLGDLGYFDSGEFHPIFNIFQSYEQNIAEGARPPSQPYQHLHIDGNWVRQLNIPEQQTYTSSNIEKREEVGPHTQNSYQFRTHKKAGRNGAIIVLPHGGSSSCVRGAYFHLPEVKQHFREHAQSWYQHALQYIPKMNNGSLILVRATHCARSWGIAAFASKEDTREPLTAAFMSNPANKYQHMWQMYDRKWNTDTGPSFEELRELGGREPPLNQCIGVVISSLRLDNSTWQANFESLSSASDHGGGWRLSRTVSGDSWRTIHVEDSGRRRVLDSIMGRPTDIRHTSYGSDDYTLLLQEP